jgi:hypothetical protein
MEQFGAEQRAGRLAGMRRCLGITRAAHVTAPACAVTVVLTRGEDDRTESLPYARLLVRS